MQYFTASRRCLGVNVAQRKEIISIYDKIDLYRLNVDSKDAFTKELTTELNITYGTLISN